ncbi:MAG TPA: hypothetical protein VGE79_18025, partial [Niastella sp.]
MKALQLLLIVFLCLRAAAQDTSVYIPEKWKFITNVPADLLKIAKSPFKKTNLTGFTLVAASTALLIPFDQKILD